ncbi:MAG: PAS domain S-box protein, partial [Nanoarchaeota archaeon]|nr:PAS domain S-box protein [Nanoarchaeota archaeon]MBU1854696.1 PAS domain S-box protein [Nanoarchaeota archaeon]
MTSKKSFEENKDNKSLVEIIGNIFKDLTEMFFISKDITTIKEAEEKLKHNQRHLSNALQIARLGPWEYDAIKNQFTFTDELYAMFHTTAEQMGGYTMSPERYTQLFLHPDDVSLVGAEIQKAMETTDPNFNRQFEHRIIYADGTAGHISVRFFIIKDAQGNTIQTYGVNQDITERKEAEEALKESEETYRLLVETSKNGIVISQKDKFIFINECFANILGYEKEELLMKNYEEVYTEDGVETLLERQRRRNAGEEIPLSYETTFRR